MAGKAGEAYLFFKCNAAPDEISDIIQDPNPEKFDVRKATKVPEEMELNLNELESLDVSNYDKSFKEIYKEAKEVGMNYSLVGRLPGADNCETADIVADVFNQLFNTSLYENGEIPEYGLFYKDENTNEYVFRD